ncbi:MAG: HAMP domain-containing protein [Actinobacteria bacterium]|nr:MAG: HAMP domain-containing protein [Actinomycetota bacterium]
MGRRASARVPDPRRGAVHPRRADPAGGRKHDGDRAARRRVRDARVHRAPRRCARARAARTDHRCVWTTLAFTSAFGAFAIAEATTALSTPGTGALLIFAHCMRALGALLLARWLWTSIVQSVRLRFVAAFVAVLTIAVLIVSAALNVVIGNTLQTNELNRLLEAGSAREASIQNLGEGALVPAQITASSSAVVDALQKEQRLDLSGIFKLLPLDFVMLVDHNGKALSAKENVPGRAARDLPVSESIGIVGQGVVQQARQGFPGQTALSVSFASGKSPVQSQILVVAASPAKQAGRVIGVVVVGYRIDRSFLLLVRQDTVADATILVGDQVSSTTFRSAATVSQAFSHIDFASAREIGTPLQRIVTIGGSQYVSAFVPVKANDGTVIGLLGLSRKSTTLADAQRNITRTLFLITLAVVLIAALLAWLSGGRVTKPIRSLTSAARQLRAGQLTARTGGRPDRHRRRGHGCDVQPSGRGDLAPAGANGRAPADRRRDARPGGHRPHARGGSDDRRCDGGHAIARGRLAARRRDDGGTAGRFER